MPVWHNATKALQDSHKVRFVGIIQEQHPDRCKLFMQWKRMEWPILIDSLNLLDVSAVPILLGIDEQGIVRRLPRDPARLEEEFLKVEYPAVVPPTPRDPFDSQSADLVRAHKLILTRDEDKLDKAIKLYSHAVQTDPGDGHTHFRLGVAYRMRYDSDQRQIGDFQKAVAQWQNALDTNPNQYIWRRRIQQYGPLLDKPYPFYDWVETARKEIIARGETPAKLIVEPGGAELAGRGAFSPSKGATEPDAQGRITRDGSPLIDIQTVVVPAVIKPGETARVHVVMRPNVKAKGHWNNEAGELAVWINPPQGWEVDRRLLGHDNAATDVSGETREVEFEVRAPSDAKPGAQKLSAYALYYVCEDVNGTCLYRRQDLSVDVTVRTR